MSESKEGWGRESRPSVEVADRVHSAAIHLLRALRKEDDRSGLSAPRLSALSVLVFRGATRLTDLAAAEQVRPPTMTRIVAGLERDGLVHRKVDDTDARAVLLSATPRGTRLLHAGRRRRIAALARALQMVPAHEMATLDRAAAVIEAVATTITRARG